MTAPAPTIASTAPAEIPPWFPTIEANQGFISIAALMLALIAFIFETIRANGAARERREEFREALIGVCDELEKSLDQGEWHSATNRTYEVVEALFSAAPPSPKLITEAVVFRRQVQSWDSASSVRLQGANFEERRRADLKDWRRRFEIA